MGLLRLVVTYNELLKGLRRDEGRKIILSTGKIFKGMLGKVLTKIMMKINITISSLFIRIEISTECCCGQVGTVSFI